MGLKYRPLRPRRGVRSTRAVIRMHRPWRPWLVAAMVLAVMIGVGVALWRHDSWHRPAEPATVSADFAEIGVQLRQQLAEVSGERDRLRASANTAEAQLQMARAAQERLAEQLKATEAEVAQLKEDLGFFESLLPATGDTTGIHVRSFRVSTDEAQPHAVHYRLLVMQGGSKAFVEQPEFRGDLQFMISAIRGGKPLTLTLPHSNGPSLPTVRLTHYQRIEGDLAIPQDAEVRAVSVRIVQGGQVRATQSATP